VTSSASRILEPHPATPPGAAFRITAEAARESEGFLAFRFGVEGPVTGLEVPAPVDGPQQRHLLWKHTCFEAFVAATPGGPYHELNFSPSGDWAHYAFRAYREGGWVEGDGVAPGIQVERGPARFALSARIPLAGLSPDLVSAPLHVALSGVLEEKGGRISYWALHHPAAQADFHHAAAFTLRLDPPTREGGRPA
jgi:hypothetical protein